MRWARSGGGWLLSWAAASVLPAVLVGWLALTTSAIAQTPDPRTSPSAVLIFDGSGSMWGKLDGERQIKLAQARDAVKAALAKMQPQSVQFGLMSFGHRRQADCGDVQVIAPPEAVTGDEFTERIITPLDKLNPKGKGPLTVALREAAKLLGKAEGPRSIVLIHDDPDNCQQDPCAALAEMQQSAPGVVVHVVGLGLNSDDALRYQCLTRPTGGRHINAQDGAAIAAGIGEVLQLATAAAAPSSPAQAKIIPQPAPLKPSPPPTAPVVASAAAAAALPPIDLTKDGPPAIRLRALVGKDRLASGVPVHWEVLAEPGRAGASPVAKSDGPEPVLPISPGTYRVSATSGLVRAETVVTVADKGQALAQIVFDAGEIHIRAPLAADAIVIVAERATATVPVAGEAKGSPSGGASGRQLGVWPPGLTRLLVPARPLVLVLEQAELRSAWPIEVAAGEIKDIDVGQAGGRVMLDLMAGIGGAPPVGTPFANQPVVYTIEEDDPDAPRGRREIARSASSVAEFVVAPGTYVVTAARGPLLTRERIGVVAGEVVRRSLPLASSRLVLGARLGKTVAASSDRPLDSFLVAPLGGDRDTSFLLQGPAAVIDVPPGRYRIEARRNNAAIRAEQIVEIRAGEYKAVTLEYQAGALRVETVNNAAQGEPLEWRVIDGAGRLIDSGDEGQTTSMLPAGRYTLRIEVRGRRRDVPVEIKTGEISSVRLQ